MRLIHCDIIFSAHFTRQTPNCFNIWWIEGVEVNLMRARWRREWRQRNFLWVIIITLALDVGRWNEQIHTKNQFDSIFFHLCNQPNISIFMRLHSISSEPVVWVIPHRCRNNTEHLLSVSISYVLRIFYRYFPICSWISKRFDLYIEFLLRVEFGRIGLISIDPILAFLLKMNAKIASHMKVSNFDLLFGMPEWSSKKIKENFGEKQ